MKTTGAIIAVILSLFLHPEVSQCVFEEIQSVTHGARLPSIADRPSLPYTEAVFKESMRIRPFMPIGKSLFRLSALSWCLIEVGKGVPHVNTQDEVIRGYLIPEGTMIHQCV
jgi:hypothetical protein